MLIDVDRVVGAFAGSPDQECALDGCLNLN
jgi:hypothetical protein